MSSTDIALKEYMTQKEELNLIQDLFLDYGFINEEKPNSVQVNLNPRYRFVFSRNKEAVLIILRKDIESEIFNQGILYLFFKKDDLCYLVGEFINPENSNSFDYGACFAIDAECQTVFISDPGYNNQGCIYIYKKDDTTNELITFSLKKKLQFNPTVTRLGELFAIGDVFDGLISSYKENGLVKLSYYHPRLEWKEIYLEHEWYVDIFGLTLNSFGTKLAIGCYSAQSKKLTIIIYEKIEENLETGELIVDWVKTLYTSVPPFSKGKRFGIVKAQCDIEMGIHSNSSFNSLTIIAYCANDNEIIKEQSGGAILTYTGDD